METRTSHFQLCTGSPLLTLLLAYLVGACGDGGGRATVPEPATCDGAPAWQQPTHRFPVGSTFLLPDCGDAGAGAGAAWTLAKAPAGNANAIVEDARFTPHLPGDYVFAREGAADVSLTVVDAAHAPFVNYNYYPTRSLAQVGAELWVANVASPTLSVLPAGTIVPVGAWPVALAYAAGMDVVLVAERGADRLAFVDVATHRIVDALHVGDEPANVVVAPDGKTAYVALATSGELVVVDVAKRRVGARLPLAPDLGAMAMAPDGATLYVARRRSGQPGRYPYPSDPFAEERDVFVVDTASVSVANELLDVGATIGALEVSADGATLYLAGVSNDTEGPLSQDASHSFVQEVKAFSTASLTMSAQADLSRQASSSGPVVSLAGLAEHDGKLWVAAEGLDQVIALDPVTLAEVARVDAPGRPRALLAAGDSLHVHGAQGFQVTTIDAGAGATPRTVTTAPDPRPEAIARGQRYFTGQGRSFATTWSCNSCHADALTDTQVWNAGPLVDRVVARPFVWLEGAYPLGWSGYMYDVFNYAYEVNGNVGIRPVTQEATDLGAYLASLTAPPPANDATLLDGRLDAQAERGKALFEGDAGCVGCHPLPLSTSRRSYTPGITEGVSDVPVLVGAYRYGTWLKHGEARDLRSAVLAAHDWVGGGALTDAQIDDLTHYVAALTGRDFFVLTTTPRADGKPIAADSSLEVTFSLPVWDDPANLAHIVVSDAAGAAVAHATSVSADGRHVTLTPSAPLAPDAELHVAVDAALESYDERHALAATFDFRTARAPLATARLDGDYVWTVAMPSFNPSTGFDPSSTFPVSVPVRATPTAGGARLHLDLGQGLELERSAVVDGDQLYMPPLPIPIGPSFGDTVPDAPVALAADAAAGSFTLAGPGFFVPDVAWSLARAPVGCSEGTTGNVTVDMSESGEITWAGSDAALALYVTDAAANIPLGPGAVTGGASYWILQSSAFPAGFAAPVTYGSVPSGAVDAGAASMAHFEPLTSGHCYKVTVTTTAFKQGARTVLWP